MIFIAGIERSASTWVSNILESHPDTEVFMEPLSIFTTRFEKWGSRFEVIEDLDEKAEYFRSEFSVLKNRKRWFLTEISEQTAAWNLDLTLAEFLVRKNIATDSVKDFYELNFHRKDSYQWNPKSENNRVDVVKTLRLNFNPKLFEQIDPDSKLIITFRDMASNVQSILKQFKQNNLSELKAEIINEYGAADVESVFKYWCDSYNSLLKFTEDTSVPVFIFDHTHMLMNQETALMDLMNFTGFKPSKSVKEYMEASDRSGKGVHNTDRSHDTLLKQIKADREFIYPKIRTLLDSSDLHPEIIRRMKDIF